MSLAETTPAWAFPVLEQIADPDILTRDLNTLRADIRLTRTIMKQTGPADIQEWMEDEEQLPPWARAALHRFLVNAEGFEKNRLIAELDTLENLVTSRLGFD